MIDRLLRRLQYVLLTGGIVLLAVTGAAIGDRAVSSRAALSAFDQARADSSREGSATRGLPAGDDADFSLWSEKRIRQYRESMSVETRLPLAVLGISRLHIRVPVFEGTDDLALNRGAGWIAGTARPGQAGNIGIAAHRDGFFRGLKDIVVGDAVELATVGGQATYVVEQIEVVSPESVEVLRPRSAPSLTLVTCYPFYFVGDAPQRFIVHATLARSATQRLDGGRP
jgi:sortase A